MSSSSLYKVYKTKTKEIAEFRNGWGTAPVIWGYLLEKYLHLDKLAWFGNDENQKKLWKLITDSSVPTNLRLVLGLTLDDAICPYVKKDELAKACQEVFEFTYDSKSVNHWKSVGESLKLCKPDKKMIGIALSCTSVADQWIDGKGDKAWDLFSVIK